MTSFVQSFSPPELTDSLSFSLLYHRFHFCSTYLYHCCCCRCLVRILYQFLSVAFSALTHQLLLICFYCYHSLVHGQMSSSALVNKSLSNASHEKAHFIQTRPLFALSVGHGIPATLTENTHNYNWVYDKASIKAYKSTQKTFEPE